MKTKLLRKLRKKAKQKIRLYQTSERIYKVTNPYFPGHDTYYSGNLESIKEDVIEARRNYILDLIHKKQKTKEKYPKLINI